MRSKEKVTTRDEVLRNFTREFLIEEKKRCEIDRYVTDFRILIHKRPHENHNYLNRLLQDYTNMFLSHERIAVNKMNQEEVKHQLRSQLASRKKDSPKQRYVKSKLSEKNQTNSEHQSYLVLKAKTEKFLQTLREYDELEQIAYKIFIENSNQMKNYQYEIEPNTILKLKSSDVSSDIPYKKHFRNVYVVNSPKAPEKKSEKQNIQNPLEDYAFVKKETEKFLLNNMDYNDAEQRMLSEQYHNNTYIKKYVDTLTSSEKSKKESPKKGIFSKIKNMIGFSPESSSKFYKNVENNHEALVDKTKMFLRNERKYNNFEFEAYKLFYIKNGEFQNPLIEVIEKIAYEKQTPSNKTPPENGKHSKIKQKLALKNVKSNQRSSEEKEFEDFNLVKCSPSEKIESDPKLRDIKFQFESANVVPTTEQIPNKTVNGTSSKSPSEEFIILRDNVNDFLNKQKLYDDQQRYYYVIHMRKYHVNPVKEKKEGLLSKIKHLFFGKQDKSKEKIKYFKDITQDFLRNEQYYHDMQKQALFIFSKNHEPYQGFSPRDLDRRSYNRTEKENSQNSGKTELNRRSTNEKPLPRPVKLFEETNSPPKKDKNKKNEKSATLRRQDKTETPPPSLHHRSKSEDLLMFRTKTKSLESKKSPTGHKTISDRLKSMVGIGNRGRTKSRDMLRSTDPLQYFLDHERFYYDGTPVKQGKYTRSVSSIEYMPKDGTIKTKTKRFLSTENVLYQDHNPTIVGKPPTGRRRKEERNRDSKEKRRSRTLSPAQKLVSKIRNLVQKNPEKDKEHGASKREETGDFMSDHKRFNDMLGPNEVKRSNENLQLHGSNLDTSKSPTEPIFAKVEGKFIKSTTPTIEKEISSSEFCKETRKEKSSGKNTFDDPEFVNRQTKIFLDDLKKYHDLDKEPNTVDKTLIFINNKDISSTIHDNEMLIRVDNEPNEEVKRLENTHFKSTVKVREGLPETREEKSIESKKIENETIKHIGGGYTTFDGSTKVVQNTIRKETRVTERRTTESVQRTTKKITTQEWNSPNILNEIFSKSRSSFDEPEHIYENVSFSKAQSRDISCESPSPALKQDKSHHVKSTIFTIIPSDLTAEAPEKCSSMKQGDNERSEKVLKESSSPGINVAKSDIFPLQMNTTPTIQTDRKTVEKVFYNFKELNTTGNGLQKENEQISKLGSVLSAPQKPVSIEKHNEMFDGRFSIATAERQRSAPEGVEKSQHKEVEPKKSTFSKLKSYVTGTTQKPSNDDSYKLLRKYNTEFLDDMRKHHDEQKETVSNYNIVWLSETKPKPQETPTTQPSKPVAMTDKERAALEVIRQNTDIFLKDHQDYHNKQRTLDNEFFVKIGKPEHLIWLSSSPKAKKDTIITKVKKLMSPQQSKKSITETDEARHKLIRDQTDEFLKKHQYLIHKEETDFMTAPISENIVQENVSVVTAEKQKSASERVQKSPQKEVEPKKSTFSKLKSYVTGTTQKPSNDDSYKLLRKYNTEFLDDMRKHHDEQKETVSKYNIVWLSETKPKPQETPRTQPSKPVAMTDKERAALEVIRQNTDIFLKDHQDYHNKQKTQDNDFLEKFTKSKQFIWHSNKPVRTIPASEQTIIPAQRKNIISKVKNILSPSKTVDTAIFYYDVDDKDGKRRNDSQDNQIDILENEEYLIHQNEIEHSNPKSMKSNNNIEGTSTKILGEPLRQITKKKVTFSGTHAASDPEVIKWDEQEFEDPNVDASYDFHQGSINLSSKIPLEPNKPQIIPRKQTAKKVKTVFIDSAEIFRQNKDHYLIQETNNFLEDHKNHQNTQWVNSQNVKKNEEIRSKSIEGDLMKKPETKPRVMEKTTTSSAPPQQKTYSRDPDDSKEPKLKTKLISKFKSLVGSQENISPDKKREIETALTRKQTLEFLISQKCYNDLEGDASYKFYLKQLEKGTLGKKSVLEEIGASPENDMVSEGDSTFCYPRQSAVKGSPKNNSTMIQEPQKSSPDKKISKTAKITIKEKTVSKLNRNEVGKHVENPAEFLRSIEQNNDFLSSQRHYINSEHGIWNHYLKYKPEAGSKRKLIQPEKSVQNYIQVQSAFPIPKAPTRKPSSQIESDRIDHEVILHKTMLFLEDHKRYHDNLQDVSTESSSKQPKTTIIGDEEQRDGVLTKIKSVLPSGPRKNRSYDIQKAEILNSEHKKESEIPKSTYLETHTILETTPSVKESDINLKNQTMLFLKDHQDYHGLEKSHCKEYKWKGDDREKKPKKNVISKIKSLITGDHKKAFSKKPTITTPHENLDVDSSKLSIEKQDDILIRELESSPATYRRNRQPQIAGEKTQNIISRVQNNEFEKSSIVGVAEPISHVSKTTLHVETEVPPAKGDLKPKILDDTGAEYKTKDDDVFLWKKLSYDQIEMLPENERKKYAFAKIKTQEFLLNQKQFTDADSVQKTTAVGEIKPIINFTSGEKNKSKETSDIVKSEQTSHVTIEQKNSVGQGENQTVQKTRIHYLPSAPSLEECEELSAKEKENVQYVVHRMVKPLSPTKTIFKEIRQREDSPDRKVYIMKEGYMITKENKEDNELTKKVGRKEHIGVSRRATTREESREQHSSISTGKRQLMKPEEEFSRNQLPHAEGSISIDSKIYTEGQDCVDRTNDSPLRSVPQGDLEVRRHRTKQRTFGDMEKGPTKVVTETRIEQGSNGEEKYITTCFLNKVPTPVWYTESLLLDLEEKTKKTDVKVYYDELYQPYRWEESFKTNLSLRRDIFKSEVTIPVVAESEEIHYISLEHQQQQNTA